MEEVKAPASDTLNNAFLIMSLTDCSLVFNCYTSYRQLQKLLRNWEKEKKLLGHLGIMT